MQMPLFGTTECRISIALMAEEGLFISWSRFSDSHTLPPPAETLPRAAAVLNGCEHARSRNREGDKRTRQEMNSGQKASADRITLSHWLGIHTIHTQPYMRDKNHRCGRFDTKGRLTLMHPLLLRRAHQVTMRRLGFAHSRAVEKCRRCKQIAPHADVSNFSQLVGEKR